MIVLNQSADAFCAQYLANNVSENTVALLKNKTLGQLCFDSREVKAGDVFVALPSVAGNELQYIKTAAEKGCVLVIAQLDLGEIESAELSVSYVQVNDVMDWSGAYLRDQFSGKTDAMDLVGITGTNGKSSISFYLAQLLEQLGQTCGVMGTLGYGSWQKLTATGMTTLPLEKLHSTLATMSSEYKTLAMEVSSHGLEQKRLAGVKFKGAAFSNLSRDHLDYHCTMEAYGAEKAKLFAWPDLEFAVINQDDNFGCQLLDQVNAGSTVPNIMSYGQLNSKDQQPDVAFTIDKVTNHGLQLRFEYQGQNAHVMVPLYGEFNAYNACAALACAIGMGHNFAASVAALNRLQAVEGRMMQVKLEQNDNNAQAPLVLVDYAHTPDALQQVLESVQNHCAGNIHVLVGCGGDRDQGKRPLIAQIAVQFADKIMFTSDNPRSESPQAIIDQMVSGVDGNIGKQVEQELDRKIAIHQVIKQANKNDLVVIAGKGHEDYQEINGQRNYFSDKEVALEALTEKSRLEKTT